MGGSKTGLDLVGGDGTSRIGLQGVAGRRDVATQPVSKRQPTLTVVFALAGPLGINPEKLIAQTHSRLVE